MAKHRHIWNQSVYERFLHDGRGQGIGPEYKPWIYIQDFSSQGTVSRVKGRKTGRVHHLMSNNELAYFYILDWSDSVLDIREQYPLADINTAMNIAQQAEIRYPIDNISGFPYILTCDFMVTTDSGYKARTVKLSTELSNKRVLEKLEIERRYWAMKAIDWRIITEKEICFRKAQNIEWLYSAQDFEITRTTPRTETEAIELMYQMLRTHDYSVNEAAKTAEEDFLLAKGTGLFFFKYLVLKKRINIDLNGILDLNAKKELIML